MDRKKLERVAEGLQKIQKVLESLHEKAEPQYEYDLDMAGFNIGQSLRNLQRLTEKMDRDNKK